MSDAIQPKLTVSVEAAIAKAAHDVAPLYAANRWTWGTLGSDEIPNAVRLRHLLRSLTMDLLRLDLERVASGRLSVERLRDGDMTSLGFSLELGEVEAGTECS